MDELVTAYQLKTGRTLSMIERDVEPGQPSGLYEQYLLEDRIYFPRTTSPAHQALVVCHELAHLLLGHTPRSHGPIDSNVVRRVLGRDHYAAPAEREAELFGTLLFHELNLEPRAGAEERVAPALTHREGRHA
ncbi:ImmA/IrrE family metallo-endopeptidase [Streptomyces sp. PTM05]|uniref:ImmA/IrrE family metallo-endopeptidase n=2 Tax=Streptantibioticus parmotrematis TaxID=2873249 RepID=A0ABS7QVP9_9ACTN|nr:ImmA/IrrE family metallo-endopeptidase [Streptantibioticus parmotrematis]